MRSFQIKRFKENIIEATILTEHARVKSYLFPEYNLYNTIYVNDKGRIFSVMKCGRKDKNQFLKRTVILRIVQT